MQQTQVYIEIHSFDPRLAKWILNAPYQNAGIQTHEHLIECAAKGVSSILDYQILQCNQKPEIAWHESFSQKLLDFDGMMKRLPYGNHFCGRINFSHSECSVGIAHYFVESFVFTETISVFMHMIEDIIGCAYARFDADLELHTFSKQKVIEQIKLGTDHAIPENMIAIFDHAFQISKSTDTIEDYRW